MDNSFFNDIDNGFDTNPFADFNAQNGKTLSIWDQLRAERELAKQQLASMSATVSQPNYKFWELEKDAELMGKVEDIYSSNTKDKFNNDKIFMDVVTPDGKFYRVNVTTRLSKLIHEKDVTKGSSILLIYLGKASLEPGEPHTYDLFVCNSSNFSNSSKLLSAD